VKIRESAILEALSAAKAHTSSRLSLIGKEALERPGIVGAMGLVLNAAPPEDMPDDAVHAYQMVLEHARISEAQGPGSLHACVVYAERLARGAHTTPPAVSGRAFTSADVERIATGILSDADASALASFVREAGASRYVVERVPSRFDSVEFVDNYEFQHASKAVDGTVVMDNARVLVADGYVESVSEIHGILDRCGRDGERLLICGRGFSDDVLHTLAVNRARGTLAAYGLTFPYNEEDANTLVDIATILGGDVVSSLKGQLFNTVDVASLPRVPYARLRGQILDFRGDGAATRATQVLATVQQKIAEAEEPTRSILEKRARRLSGSCMIVRLVDGIEHLSRLEAWDTALRSLKIATRGVVSPQDNEAWSHRDVVPLASLATAHELARKLVRALRSLHSVV
jgi:hypothetical protein